MASGYLALVLHAHLPFVRHPESDYVLEEEWLYEAITETYIPLLQVFSGLKEDGIDFKLTLTLTPPLVAMLKDPLLQERYDQHLAKLQELSAKEIEHHHNHGHLKYLAEFYHGEFGKIRQFWEDCDRDLIRVFKQFQDSNNLDIMTCGATHGYLPLMRQYPEAVWGQLKVAVEDYQDHFGQAPRGIWLPECAYYEGLERMLADVGLKYFIIDGHGVLYSRPRPRYGSYAPIYTETGVAAFGRDHESSQQVWSSQVGYPGDGLYREFYKDLGWEADYEYIKPYIMPDGQRKNTGIKYHRITSRQTAADQKALYDPYWAKEKAAHHAGDFMVNRQKQISHLAETMDRSPVVVSPYDAELFGHWWYEGPWFLDYLYRKSWYEQSQFSMVHLSGYLQDNPQQQIACPAQSSWGLNGFHEYWLNESNRWIYPHLHKAAERMITLSQLEPEDELQHKALNQAARELLLAQSSDWAFIMRTGTMVPYAERRTKSHILRFTKLYEDLTAGEVDGGWLTKVETIDNIFLTLTIEFIAP